MTQSKTRPSVTFFSVNTPQDKFLKLVETARSYYEKKVPFLILAEKDHLETLDDLLWKYPKDSFLPHTLTNIPTSDLLVLTGTRQNLNNADALFNLSSAPVTDESFYATKIYSLEDNTSSEKHRLFQDHYHAYKTRSYSIISL